MDYWRLILSLSKTKKYNEAIDLWISVYSKINDSDDYYLSSAFIGRAYLAVGRIDKAYDCALASLEFKHFDRHPIAHYIAHTVLGDISHRQGNDYKSIEHFKSSLVMIMKHPNYELEKAGAFNNIGGIQNNLGLYRESEKNISKSIEYSELLGDLEGAAISYSNLAMLYDELKVYPKALLCIDRALELTVKSADLELITEFIIIEVELLLAVNKNDKAFSRFKDIPLKRDKILKEYLRKRYDELEGLLREST